MALDFLLSLGKKAARVRDSLRVDSQIVPLRYVRHRRARRYILRLQPDGVARVTVPQAGSLREAWAFAVRHRAWIAGQLQHRRDQPVVPASWQHGTEILYRGQPVPLQVTKNHDGQVVSFADQTIGVADGSPVRAAVEQHLWRVAVPELLREVHLLARQHQIAVRRVTVRCQRSRWGSSSRHGTISLNWRLIQVPAFVRSYVILHELMHQREMNHSPRFWAQVAAVCPQYQQATAWLRQHRGLLREATTGGRSS